MTLAAVGEDFAVAEEHEIRAYYDRETIALYQAYSPAIADAALGVPDLVCAGGCSPTPDEWSEQFAAAQVHLQWDPERSLRGAGLAHYSIQVGLSRHVIREYVDEWVAGIEDITPRVRKIYDLLQSGQADKAKRQLPPERVYPVGPKLGRHLLIGA